ILHASCTPQRQIYRIRLLASASYASLLIDTTNLPAQQAALPIEAKPVYNAAQFSIQICYLLTRERGSATMKRNVIRLFVVAAAAAFLFALQTMVSGQTTPSTQHKAQLPRSVRLYVFDCGVLHNSDMGRFNLKKEDVTTTDMSIACFLVAHPKGNLIWDTGAIPDDSWKPTGRPVSVHVTLPDGQARDADVDKTL